MLLFLFKDKSGGNVSIIWAALLKLWVVAVVIVIGGRILENILL